VLDVELKFWEQSPNWQPVPAFGSLPTNADFAAVPVAASVINGQMFSVIANKLGPIAARGNVSRASLQAILTGVYNVWGDVPEVGGGNSTPITLCRFNKGASAQIATSIFLTGFECGYSSTSIASTSVPGALGAGNVSEETSTNSVRICVQDNVGSIGIQTLSTGSNWATLNIDGVQANAHNAAAGFYTFAFDTVAYNLTSVSGASNGAKDLTNLFINAARRATDLISQIEGTAVQNSSAMDCKHSSKLLCASVSGI
jgi:hypothetical protein